MGWIRDLVAGRPGRQAPAGPLPPPDPGDVRIATAVLLIEVSAADDEVDPRETEAIVAALRDAFGLSAGETGEVVALAGKRSREAVSLYEFTRLVDRAFTREQKATVIELLFRVAFADGRLVGEEEHLIRKAATLLHVEHPDFIAARMRAKPATTTG